MKRLLVCLDGSPSSRTALSVSASLASIMEADLVGVFVQDEARFRRVPLGMAIMDSLVGEAIPVEPLAPEEYLAEEEKVQSELKNIRTEFLDTCEKSKADGQFLTFRGDPIGVMHELSRGVDMVLLGRTGMGKNPIGHSVNALVDRVTCPVLVVPQDAEGDETVVVGYDGSVASERVLRVTAGLAVVTRMDSVHVLTVGSDVEEGKKMQTQAVDYLRSYDLEVISKIVPGKPEEVITAYADDVDASIVSLGAFGYNRLKDRIFGTTASHLLASMNRPLLLIA